jgi:hypothetical protein
MGRCTSLQTEVLKAPSSDNQSLCLAYKNTSEMIVVCGCMRSALDVSCKHLSTNTVCLRTIDRLTAKNECKPPIA